jgi:hypothetical protein
MTKNYNELIKDLTSCNITNLNKIIISNKITVEDTDELPTKNVKPNTVLKESKIEIENNNFINIGKNTDADVSILVKSKKRTTVKNYDDLNI